MKRQDDVFEEFAREFIRRRAGGAPRWPVERILVATDFSLCSLRALEHAEQLARQLRAEIILLHVEPVPLAAGEMADLSHAAAERELARTVKQLRDAQLDARSVLRSGGPAEEILKIVELERVDLVILGTHGRKGVLHMLLGSVAERVVRSAPCPVLTVALRKDD